MHGCVDNESTLATPVHVHALKRHLRSLDHGHKVGLEVSLPAAAAQHGDHQVAEHVHWATEIGLYNVLEISRCALGKFQSKTNVFHGFLTVQYS